MEAENNVITYEYDKKYYDGKLRVYRIFIISMLSYHVT